MWFVEIISRVDIHEKAITVTADIFVRTPKPRASVKKHNIWIKLNVIMFVSVQNKKPKDHSSEILLVQMFSDQVDDGKTEVFVSKEHFQKLSQTLEKILINIRVLVTT